MSFLHSYMQWHLPFVRTDIILTLHTVLIYNCTVLSDVVIDFLGFLIKIQATSDIYQEFLSLIVVTCILELCTFRN